MRCDMKKLILVIMIMMLCGLAGASTWQQYIDKSSSMLVVNNSSATHLWILDMDNTIVGKRSSGSDTNTARYSLSALSFDDISYDEYDGSFWTTKEASDSEIYHFTMSPITGRIILSEMIRFNTGTLSELEAVCADPYTGVIYCLDDKSDQATLSVGQRVGDGGAPNVYQEISSTSIYNANPLLGVASGQGICYDRQTNTLWIVVNTDHRIYNYTVGAVLISSIDATLFTPDVNKLQGIYHDYATDTLYVAERDNGVHHISKAGVLIKFYPNVTGSSGPTGVCLVPRQFSPLTPYVWWSMDDAAAQTAIVDTLLQRAGVSDDNVTKGATAKIGTSIDFEKTELQFFSFTPLALKADFTLSAWVNFETVDNVIWGEAGNEEWIRFETNSDIQYTFNNQADGQILTAVEHGFTFSTSGFHHIVIRRFAGHLYVYLDGVLGASPDTATYVHVFTPDIIGAKNAGDNFDGILDELMIFDYALTDADVATLYNNGTGIGSIPDVRAPTVRDSGLRSRYSGTGRY